MSFFFFFFFPSFISTYTYKDANETATYGYAKQYSGVNLGSFLKHITSSNLTAEGLYGLAGTVEQLASVEGLEAHKRAVSIRVAQMNRS